MHAQSYMTKSRRNQKKNRNARFLSSRKIKVWRFAKIVSFTIPSVTKKRYCSLVERINNLTLDDRSLHYNQIQLLNSDHSDKDISSTTTTTQSKNDQLLNKTNQTKRKNKRSTANYQSLETRAYNYMRPPSPKRKRIKVR
ncbi:UNKNOWN [Stylonychia lemnae]|uniref:Uncharacterized protein n=1 Tax=Stylonychia lemnae TaxID=5949 RepID=A0A078ARB9_STYLE|nr:UNKNOWN [Stylonychia lemnae]|eukprot:CDW83772.1 UNKNOWN [Stylonychia lemnae]